MASVQSSASRIKPAKFDGSDEVIWDATIEAAIHDPSTGEDSPANQFAGRTLNSSKLNTERNQHVQDIAKLTNPQSTQAERTAAKLRKYIGQTAASEGKQAQFIHRPL